MGKNNLLLSLNDSEDNSVGEGEELYKGVVVPSKVKVVMSKLAAGLKDLELKKPAKVVLVADIMSFLGITTEDVNQYYPLIKKKLKDKEK